ncbi:MAG: mechanosensitive ion channel [Deltaproteobacteria bacterium]|jgi:small-conductance mechanosensitive channel|nr:mechanosensitive ion channel [Deltaproteobacteria bacterium]
MLPADLESAPNNTFLTCGTLMKTLLSASLAAAAIIAVLSLGSASVSASPDDRAAAQAFSSGDDRAAAQSSASGDDSSVLQASGAANAGPVQASSESPAPGSGTEDGSGREGSAAADTDGGAAPGTGAQVASGGGNGEASPAQEGTGSQEVVVQAVSSGNEADLLSLSEILLRLDELSAQMREESGKLTKLIRDTAENSQNFRREIQQRKGVTPHERENRLSQLRAQHDALTQSEKALEDLFNGFSRRLNELENSMAERGPLSVDRAQTLLADRIPLFRRTSETVSAKLAEAQKLISSLEERISRFEERIPAGWWAYYLETSSLTSFEIPKLTGDGGYIAEWKRDIVEKGRLFYPQTWEAWQQSITRFFMTAGLITLLGIILYHGAGYFPVEPVNWKAAVVGIVKGPWLYLTLGLALCNASRNQQGVNFLFFLVPGVVILIWGIAATSWKLRIAAKPTLAGQNSPLTRFYPPTVFGVFFLYAEVPTGVLSVLWFAMLFLFMYMLWKRGKRTDVTEAMKGYLLERFAYGSAGYFAVISLVINVAGYPRLAVLVFMLFFTIVNILILGNAFAELGSNFCNGVFPSDNHPVKYSILIALLLPVTWSVSLLCTLPWLIAIPGLTSILMNFLTAGHNIGSASFSISRVLMILGCFFLFRSLRRFGSTSLEHLPEEFELNQAQRMSIQTILTYLVWIAFAVIAMGLLGVNWTSLAVAAAGLGAGIGFGLQTIFNNILSGIILIFGRSVKVGDFVEVGNVSGTVMKVDFRCTEVKTLGGPIVFVPNSAIISNEFTNWTTEGKAEILKRTLVIRAYYGTDIALALRLLKAVSEDVDGVVKDPAPMAVLNDLNEKYLEFNLFVFVRPISRTTYILSDLRVKIEESFFQNGIKLYRQSLEINLSKALQVLQGGSGEDRAGGRGETGPIIMS